VDRLDIGCVPFDRKWTAKWTSQGILPS